MKKTLFIIVTALAVLSVGYLTLAPSRNSNNTPNRPPTNVEVLPVYQDTLHDKVEILGSTYGNESVEITSNITETIKQIQFTDGQQVSKGDVIVILDQDEQLAQLAAVKAQLKEHQRELGRLKLLVSKKMSPQRLLDERKTLLDITQQRLKEIESQIEDRTLKAPFDGVLGIRKMSNGALVQPGMVITTLEDINPIKLDFNVPSIYISHLRTGLPIEAISDVFPNMTFKGVIETINNRVDPVTRSILVRAIIENADRLIKPGIMMKVSLLKNKRQAIIVPEESVIQQGDKHFLMVVKNDNTVEKRNIKTGVSRDGAVEIIGNIEEGEKIVVRGVHKVRPGAQITISKTWDGIRKPQPGKLKE